MSWRYAPIKMEYGSHTYYAVCEVYKEGHTGPVQLIGQDLEDLRDTLEKALKEVDDAIENGLEVIEENVKYEGG
jgi:hypothetical protein